MTRLWDSVAAENRQIGELHFLPQRALEQQPVLELPAAPPECLATPQPDRAAVEWLAGVANLGLSSDE